MQVGTAVSNQLGYNMLFRAIEFEILPACRQYNLGILAYVPVLQGLLAGRWKTVEEIPVARRRTRHFSCTRERTRHGEPGCEELTMDALEKLGQVAARLEKPLADIALAWLLARPQVASVIVGGRKPEQVRRNLAAVELELSPGVLNELDKLTDPVKQQLGPNADLWVGQTESRIR